MDLTGKVAVVTGGASGIGRALCRRIAAAGARGVVVADRDGAGADAVAAEIGGVGVRADVSVEADVAALVARAEAAFGAVDIYCSNAGVGVGGGEDAPDAVWERAWRVHVMAQVYAARAALPGMLARGGGYFVLTASAAGLLTMIDAAPYAVTKHGTVAFAEWLAITYGDRGIKVSCLCPMAVRTPMLEANAGHVGMQSVKASGATLEPEAVADVVVAGIAAETFLLLPHPEVARFEKHRAEDRDGWLAAMRRFRAKLPG